MRRADRLFQIVEILRDRQLTTAAYLSQRLEVSVRTIYRDIQDLQASGVDIEGEAGVGYLLRHYDLAPLMFNAGEVEALVSGLQMAKAWMDTDLSDHADKVLNKIEKILPPSLKNHIAELYVLAPDFHVPEELRRPMATLRHAIRHRRKVKIDYRDAEKKQSQRVISPLGLVFWGQTWTLVAWCDLRDDFRSFRLDRIINFEQLAQRFNSEPGKRLQDFLQKVKNNDNC
ncbi:YafY family protein [Pleionea sp. CnH1-48]|uniref:helix-turn-helix transcriptional regulator n=1 Tax=Pleionea sp. CnH1-48 TaxID=2954494 RepID=UPI00209791F4|nr:YafY family protein [Pleionea sp. CnH1-48]MCO7226666.1 YafY family transcriptional regulator [Pleionea sp. CnH1-48]